MTEYWKSNPRKYCDICKCWFGDNKVSIDHHEQGKRHKENVVTTLREAREKGAKKQDAEEKLKKDLDAVERAALRSFEKDMARDNKLASSDTSYHNALLQRKKKVWDEDDRRTQADKDRREAALISSAITRAHASLPQPGEGPTTTDHAPKPPPPPNPWSKVTSSDGLTYYYNAVTKESRWSKPADFDDEPSCSEPNPDADRLASSNVTGPSTSQSSGDEPLGLVAGSKRSVETRPSSEEEEEEGEAEAEAKETKPPGPKRSSGHAYGGWTTVAVREIPAPSEEDSKKTERLCTTKEDDSDEDEDELPRKGRQRFKEKTLGASLLTEDNSQTSSSLQPKNTSFKSFGFKKKVQTNMRKRNADL